MLPSSASGGKGDQGCSPTPEISFPYTHDLTVLLRLLRKAGKAVPGEIEEAGRLTRFAIVTRYPGLAEPVTREEYEKAVAIADAVIEWAEKKIT